MDAGFGVRIALHADGLARALPRTRVSLGALTADRQAAEVADAAVALDTLEALQVHTDFAAQIAFDHVFAFLDGVHDLRKLRFAQIFSADGAINIGALQNLLRIDRTNSVNVTKRDIDALFRRNVHT